MSSTNHVQKASARSKETEPGLVAFYDFRPGTERVYSFNPGAHTGLSLWKRAMKGLLLLSHTFSNQKCWGILTHGASFKT